MCSRKGLQEERHLHDTNCSFGLPSILVRAVLSKSLGSKVKPQAATPPFCMSLLHLLCTMTVRHCVHIRACMSPAEVIRGAFHMYPDHKCLRCSVSAALFQENCMSVVCRVTMYCHHMNGLRSWRWRGLVCARAGVLQRAASRSHVACSAMGVAPFRVAARSAR